MAIATFTHLTLKNVQAILDMYRGCGPSGRPDRAPGGEAASTEVRSIRPLAAGTVNTNVAVELASGERLFLRVNEGKTPADVAIEANIIRHIADKGVAVGAPMATADGMPFVRFGDKIVSLFPWLPGRHLTHAEVGPAEVRQVGAALARLHQAGADFPDRPAGMYTVPHLEARLASFAATSDPLLAPYVPRLTAALANWGRSDQLTFSAGASPTASPGASPTASTSASAGTSPSGSTRALGAIREGIIHQDLFMDNVLFDGAPPRLSGLIDFEQAVWGRWTYDLAVCILAWCFVGNDFVGPLVRALMSGYETTISLTDAERHHLDTDAKLAAVRFAITRITDVYLRGVTGAKDFRSYVARLDVLERTRLGDLL